LALAQLPGQRPPQLSTQTAAALNAIHIKLAAQGSKPTDQVPEILEALLHRLAKLDGKLVAALVADPAFGHPGHEMYAASLPLPQKQVAARKLLAFIDRLDKDEARAAWNPELVQVVAALPDAESLPILRQQFEDPRLADSITPILAKQKHPDDQAQLIEALNSTQPAVVRVAAEALLELAKAAPKPAPPALGKAVRALHKLAQQKNEAGARRALTDLLTRWSGQKFKVDPPGDPAKHAAVWVDWYTKAYPKEAAALPGLSVTSYAAWKKRLDKIDWDAGNENKGLLVFQRKNCHRCHGDARRFGPDLTGVAQRFSRDDLFTALIQPDKDISPAYQSKAVVTTSGKIYNGMLIYESPALTLLQTTPDTTVRIPQQEMHLMYPGTVSFMPAGLLDDLHDAELADLYAYLKTLRKK
jgi:putative heme-binding domain-containing protein